MSEKPLRIPIKDAAALILLDCSNPDSPKILLGRRNKSHVFAPSKYVFPGGRVERDDARVNIYGTFASHVEQRLLHKARNPSPGKARGIALAAVRELAEETGIFLGSREIGAPESVPPLWEPFKQAGVFPSLDGVWLVARAITPAGFPRRFDTRFFAARTDLIARKFSGKAHRDAELTKLAWVTFDEAEQLDLMDITRLILNETRLRLDTGLERNMPVPFHYMRGNKRIRDEF
jgi:8-oxo-dGTP pyrophosphatase MutT (NUDIX family)